MRRLSSPAASTLGLLEDTDDYRVGWRIIAPALSATWFAGGSLVELWLACYRPPVAAPVALALLAMLAQLVAIVIGLRVRRPPPAWAPHVIVAGATVLIGCALVMARGADGGVELIFLWPTPYAFILLRGRPAAAYTLFAAIACTVLARTAESGVPVGRWMFETSTLAVLATVCGYLVTSLRRSQALLRRAFAGSPLGSGFVDADGRWVAVNDALCALTGRSSEELRWLTCDEIFEHDAGDEHRVLRPDGGSMWALVTRAPVLDAGGRVVCTSVQVQDITARRAAEVATRADADAARWLDETRLALAEGRVRLHAQPIFDVASGVRVGEEVLARLVTREGEVVPPGRFMPAVERFGLSPDFDVEVLRRAAALAAEGRPLAVNLSATSIGVPRVLDALRDAVAEHAIAPGMLTIELTETALGEDAESFVAFGNAITATGCRLALDDFGTGYGTLTYLTSLPVDVIKIDRYFVAGLDEDPARAEVISSLVGMARRLGKQTVAEGVERPEELALLAKLGVDRVQGFLLGRPEPLEHAPRVPEGHYTS